MFSWGFPRISSGVLGQKMLTKWIDATIHIFSGTCQDLLFGQTHFTKGSESYLSSPCVSKNETT